MPGDRAENTAFAVLSPVLALPIALGVTDPPVIALVCLALACAARPAARSLHGPAGCGSPVPADPGPRWITWTGLAPLAAGIACAMKATAWPALPVIAALVAAREGLRAAARFTAAAAATAAALTATFAPALAGQPGAQARGVLSCCRRCWSVRWLSGGAARRGLQAAEEGVEAGGEPFVAVVGPDVLAEGGQRREPAGWQ